MGSFSLQEDFDAVCQERRVQHHLDRLENTVARQPVLSSGDRWYVDEVNMLVGELKLKENTTAAPFSRLMC